MYKNILEKIHKYEDYTSKVVSYDKHHVDGVRVLLDLYKSDVKISDVNTEWIIKDVNSIYLGHIQINKLYRGCSFIDKFDNNCCNILRADNNFIQITLKPLLGVITLWIKLDFKFKRESELDTFKITLINWIDEYKIDFDIKRFDSDDIKNVISDLKDDLKKFVFPEYLEKEKYYVSTLFKDVS